MESENGASCFLSSRFPPHAGPYSLGCLLGLSPSNSSPSSKYAMVSRSILESFVDLKQAVDSPVRWLSEKRRRRDLALLFQVFLWPFPFCMCVPWPAFMHVHTHTHTQIQKCRKAFFDEQELPSPHRRGRRWLARLSRQTSPNAAHGFLQAGDLDKTGGKHDGWRPGLEQCC